jgi:hypothetical protein
MNAPFSTTPGEAIEREPEPIEVDPRPCMCGCTIDQHFRIDTPEGPEFYCAGDAPSDIVRQWEMADPRDRWRHTGEPAPKPSAEPRRRPEPYRPAESTVQAFWFVARNHDADYLAAWLDKHPADRPHLFRIWKAKRCST